MADLNLDDFDGDAANSLAHVDEWWVYDYRERRRRKSSVC
jgi:hypothetical protein